MNLKIDATNLVTKHSLVVTDQGVEFMETAALGGVRRFTFDQIDAVLRSSQNVLSFQVGQETFKIPMRPDDALHRTATARLVAEVRRTLRRAGA